MSKIGQKTITIPAGVQVELNDSIVTARGPKGELSVELPRGISFAKENDVVTITRVNDSKKNKSMHGLMRNLIANAVTGVEKTWQKRLEIVGTGYNVKMQGQDLALKLGYSHPVVYKTIPGIQFQVEGNNKIVVSGVDKQLVGQVAYQIKILKKPDIYKGKGIRYEGEVVRIKPGKKAKA